MAKKKDHYLLREICKALATRTATEKLCTMIRIMSHYRTDTCDVLEPKEATKPDM